MGILIFQGSTLSKLVSLKSDRRAKIIRISLDILSQLKSKEHKKIRLILF
jgi:hypothetical protein